MERQKIFCSHFATKRLEKFDSWEEILEMQNERSKVYLSDVVEAIFTMST